MKSDQVLLMVGVCINPDNLKWLVDNAESPIRYRTVTELLKVSDSRKVGLLKKELLSHSMVQFWLNNLVPNFEKNVMHSGKLEAFENAMGKLYELGVRRGMEALDEKTKPFLNWLAHQTQLPNERYHFPFSVFYRTLVASFLSMTGYSDDIAVNTWTLKRLDTIYPFVKEGKYDIYKAQDSSRSFPKAYRRYPLIDPALYPNGEMKLPWIHDINAFLHSPSIMEDNRLKEKVEVIISYILKPEYQGLHSGYGMIRLEPSKYYVMGWSIHLPAYFESNVPAKDFGHFLLLLNMLSRSKTARKHSWFKRSLSLIERFRTPNGLFVFPRNFLREEKFGYWIAGLRMALEANRKTEKASVCESTFRAFEILARIYETNKNKQFCL
jgi:hypothetical protein